MASNVPCVMGCTPGRRKIQPDHSREKLGSRLDAYYAPKKKVPKKPPKKKKDKDASKKGDAANEPQQQVVLYGQNVVKVKPSEKARQYFIRDFTDLKGVKKVPENH